MGICWGGQVGSHSDKPAANYPLHLFPRPLDCPNRAWVLAPRAFGGLRLPCHPNLPATARGIPIALYSNSSGRNMPASFRSGAGSFWCGLKGGEVMNRAHAVLSVRGVHLILAVLVISLTPRISVAKPFSPNTNHPVCIHPQLFGQPGTSPWPQQPPPDFPYDSRLLIKDVEPGLGRVKGWVQNTSQVVVEDVTISAHHIYGHVLAYATVGTLYPGQMAQWEIAEPADIPHAGRLPFNPFLGSRAR